MMESFENIQEEKDLKFIELNLWLDNIRHSNNPVDDNGVTITKGLFFVYIYGIFESLIVKLVHNTISEINKDATTLDKYKYDLYSLILRNHFDSLQNVSSKKKEKVIHDLVTELGKNRIINISEDIIPTDGRNFRIDQLKSITQAFGIDGEVSPDPSYNGYIATVVNNRNYIAHGDKTPKEVGRNYSSAEIINYYNTLSLMCDYLIGKFDLYIAQKQYLRVFKGK